ncbi:cyclase family protein [Bradyrhizobium sp. CCBAU 51765]|nr:cyclase family protein [Bradyrhizobium sp. CCBAU 51765]
MKSSANVVPRADGILCPSQIRHRSMQELHRSIWRSSWRRRTGLTSPARDLTQPMEAPQDAGNFGRSRGIPMPRKLIDISVPLTNDVTADPPGNHPTIEYIDHQQGLPRMLQFFDGLKAQDLPDGQGWAVEQVSLSTHNGTHLDAPWHFHPTMNRGERSWTIDEVPLEWCLQPGVKLDFRHLPDGYVASAADVETELKRIGHTLSPLEIVVLNTSAGAKFGRADYVNSGCGMGYEATMYLLERGVRLTGTDGWSWDAPFVYTARKYAETKDASLIWEGHKAGRHIGYCHLEKLHNLDQLPSTGFTISCFPVKIERASAGWTRAVAIIDS